MTGNPQVGLTVYGATKALISSVGKKDDASVTLVKTTIGGISGYAVGSGVAAIGAKTLFGQAAAEGIGEAVLDAITDGLNGKKLTPESFVNSAFLNVSFNAGARIVSKVIGDVITNVSGGKVGDDVANTAKAVDAVNQGIDLNKINESASIIRNTGGETVAGHALQKHSGRNPSIWGKVFGNSENINSQAMQHINDIVSAPGDFSIVTTDRGVTFLEKSLPDGRGIRLNMDGTFKGFIDQ